MDNNEKAAQALADLQQRIKGFSTLQPHHPYAVANQHILNLSAQTSWSATGLISMTGALWWALNFTADLAPPHYVVFNATGGPSADIAIFTSAVTGFFFVDPSTLHGEYNFTMQAVAGVYGEVTLSLYDMNWSQVGSFAGVVVGLSLSYISGTGTMQYH